MGTRDFLDDYFEGFSDEIERFEPFHAKRQKSHGFRDDERKETRKPKDTGTIRKRVRSYSVKDKPN